jgi:hypothetical protein
MWWVCDLFIPYALDLMRFRVMWVVLEVEEDLIFGFGGGGKV